MNSTISLESIEKEIRQETIRTIMKELNHLISSNLLVVNESSGTFVHNPIASGVSYYPKVTIDVKDREYITSLELENKNLKEQIKKIQ